MPLRPSIRFLLVAAVVSTAAACGNSTDSPSAPAASSVESTSPSATPTVEEPAGPACADVWVTGARLPEDYESCVDRAGKLVRDELIECSSGQVLIVHRNAKYAVAGGKIAAAADVNASPRFKKLLRVCKG